MTDFSGQSIGRYHIIERLGEGGMAVVYRAFDTNLECDVAIKFIRSQKLTQENSSKTLYRFKNEAQKTARLTHPNIVPVTDYGDLQDTPYLVMKYLPGGTLKNALVERLKSGQGPYTYQQAAALLTPIARALEVAHKNGLVHRDIKPSNILLTESGQPMLTDFGIAKILESEETMDNTGLGVGIGTPEYMAPEQWEGKEISGQADVYALGVVFYELITGRVPFKADTVAAVMVQALRDPLPYPSLYVKNIPEAVERIIYKAMSRDIKARYPDMAQFAQALEKLAHMEVRKGKHVQEPKPFPREKGSKETTQTQPYKFNARALLYFIGGMAVLAVVFVGGFLLWKNQDRSPERQIAVIPTIDQLATSTSLSIQAGQVDKTTTTQTPATATATSTLAALLPTPDVPIYDSFDGSSINTSKWSEPSWGNPVPFTPTQKDGALTLDLSEPLSSWRDWTIRGNRLILKMYISISMEPTTDGAVGLSLRGEQYRYDFFIGNSKVIINEKGNWNELRDINSFGGCCSKKHLMGAEANGKEITFYLDGEMIKSYPVTHHPDYGGLQILGDAHTVARVYDTWVEFLSP